MFEFITDDEQHGQIGIGTLIVFRMVLVAAIVAGVLKSIPLGTGPTLGSLHLG